ncbi:troponin C, isoallergen Bla g 6.0101 isoform X2 [Sitodiplosis mosellana]|nr:troponin C, isoallergen Bla g 6.0101 isoform X2 [Sitodiplosis mosellana]
MVEFEDLDKETVRILRNAFTAFESPEKKGVIMANDLATIVEMLGHRLNDQQQKQALREADPRNSGELDFESFAVYASRYVEVEEDAEAVAKELREAFLLYDRDAKGYITVEVLRDILHELDDKISSGDLDLMIDEIDADGSGTVDFEEFMEVMTG